MSIRQKIYINIFIVTSVAIFFCLFFIYPNFRLIKKNFDEFLQEKDKLSLLKEKENTQKKARELYFKYQNKLETFRNLFIDSDFPINLISFLENSSLNSGVQLKISSLTKTEKDGDLWPGLLFNLSLTGSPSGFLKFLEKIESAPYLIKITTFTINPRESLMTIKVFSK